ncbi:MAG: T9SS type A sorting domain-containing protein [bacterium]
MKNLLLNIVILLLITSPFIHSQISLDESYSDWDLISPAYSDVAGDNNGGIIDFKNLLITDTEKYLFLKIEVGSEIILQESNELTLYLDTDNYSTTGFSIKGIGAEIKFVFGNREGVFYSSNTTQTITHVDVGLITSPTYGSDEFEMAFNKSTEINGNKIFNGNSIRIVLKAKNSGGDELPDAGGGVSYTMQNMPVGEAAGYSIKKSNNDYLRILAYNASRDGLFVSGRTERFEKIISTIEPDIIGFGEIYNHTSGETADLISDFLPEGEWYHAKMGYDLVAVSRFPIISSYPINAIDDNQCSGAFLLDLHPKYDCKLLLIVAHPKCCGGDESNQRRQKQIDAIMAFIRDAKGEGGILNIEDNTPIIICGDMNLVGYSQQIKTFLNGDILYEPDYGPDFVPDWDNTGFDDAKPYVTNLPFVFSWHDRESDYSPGRLDFIFYTGSVMQKMNSFNLFTEALPNDSLNFYGLSEDDVTIASDHLPVVADFDLSPISSIGMSDSIHQPKEFILFQNYPNPFNASTVISFQSSVFSKIKITIYDVLGREIAELVNEYKDPGLYEVEFDGSKLQSGIYFCKLQTGFYTLAIKMIALK